MRAGRVSLGVIMCLLAGSVLGAPWRFSNPQPHGNNVLDMLFLNGVVWQVGERGQLYTSPDLDHWIPQETGTTQSLRGITVFQGNVYISGEEGTILWGPNPRELTLRNLGTSDWLEGIAASSNAVVAVGDNGAIYSSSDGVGWNRRGNYTTWLRGVAYGDEQFVTVGEEGFMATSADGQTWQQRDSGTTEHLNRVTWLKDRFWILGDGGVVLTNRSRTDFSRVQVGVTNTLFTVSANTNEVVIAGDGLVLMGPPDGSGWVRQSDPESPLLAPEWPYYSSIWDGRLFLLSGQTGMLVEGFRTNETSALNWYSTFQPTRSWLWGVTRVDDFYTAVGVGGTIVTSDDGVEWFREVTPAESAG
ncbi:MAG: WD40/YVTN/BNR-like repeat-containing protein, partial [Limisphaerales bacterium]